MRFLVLVPRFREADYPAVMTAAELPVRADVIIIGAGHNGLVSAVL